MGGTYNFPEISVNTEENIAEVEQKSLLTNCTTKLLRYYGVTLHFLDFHQKNVPKIPPLPVLLTPLLLLHLREYLQHNVGFLIQQ